MCVCHGGLVVEKRDEERMCSATWINLENIILVGKKAEIKDDDMPYVQELPRVGKSSEGWIYI